MLLNSMSARATNTCLCEPLRGQQRVYSMANKTDNLIAAWLLEILSYSEAGVH